MNSKRLVVLVLAFFLILSNFMGSNSKIKTVSAMSDIVTLENEPGESNDIEKNSKEDLDYIEKSLVEENDLKTSDVDLDTDAKEEFEEQIIEVESKLTKLNHDLPKSEEQQKVPNDNVPLRVSNERSFDYEVLADGSAKIIEYIGEPAENIVIPEKIGEHTVSEIGNGNQSVFKSYVNRTSTTVVIESDNVVINELAFARLNLNSGSLIFTKNIAKIDDKAFYKLTAEEVILPDDMHEIPVGSQIFLSASIKHFAIPLNFKTSDTRPVGNWSLFSVVTVKEPVDKSVSYSMGSKNPDAFFHLSIAEGVESISNLGLEGIRVNNIFIPHTVQSISEDAFDGIRIKESITFEDGINLNSIDIERVLDNVGNINNDIKVFIPNKSLDTIPDVLNAEIIKYNDLKIYLTGNGVEEGKVYPTIDADTDSVKVSLEFSNLETVMKDTLPSNSYKGIWKYIFTGEPLNLYDVELQIPKYFVGKESSSKLKVDFTGLMPSESVDYEVIQHEDTMSVHIKKLTPDVIYTVRLAVAYNQDISIDDQYSIDININGNIKGGNDETIDTVNHTESLVDLAYEEADITHYTMNYHSINIDDLLSLENEYNNIYDFDLAGLLMGMGDLNLVKDLKVFYEKGYLNDGTRDGDEEKYGYAYFEYDLNEWLWKLFKYDADETGFNKNKLIEGIKSEGVSLLEPDDNYEFNLEGSGYEFINPNDIKFSAEKDGEALRYIIIGDNGILKNAREYFLSGKQLEAPNFEIIPVAEDKLSISDYTEKLSIITPHMLLVYGDVDTPEETSKINIKVNKVWEDNDNQEGLRPASISVKLLKDNEVTNQVLVLDEANQWKSEFVNLDEFSNGERIEYTVEEINIPDGYTSNIIGDASTGYTIINSKETLLPEEPGEETPTPIEPIPEEPGEETPTPIDPEHEVPQLNVPEVPEVIKPELTQPLPESPQADNPKIEMVNPDSDKSNQEEQEIPETGVSSHYFYWLFIMLASALYLFTINKRKNNEFEQNKFYN